MVKQEAVLFMIFLLQSAHPVYSQCDTTYGEYEGYFCKKYCASHSKHIISCHNKRDLDIHNDNGRGYYASATTLNIWQSDIEVLPQAAFPKIDFLEILTMQDVNLSTILPGAFNGQSGILQMSFQNNNLVSISDGIFNNLEDLTVLDLSKNRIETISQHAFLGTKLERLNLSRNSIDDLASSLKDLLNLKVLDMSFNNLTDIPDAFSVEVLDALNVDHNRITSLDMNNLPSIKLFNISYNELSNLIFSTNSSVIEIRLRHNKLRSIPPLSSEVEIFDVGDNKLTNLSSDLFIRSIDLKELYLDGNGISAIPNSLFCALKHLKTLDLSNNNLTSLSYGTFDSLLELKVLNVSNNRLTSIPEAFHPLSALNELYVQHNYLEDLKMSDLTGMSQVQMINLDGNNWNCRTLRNITVHFKMSIIRGNHTNGSNVFGMKCHENSNDIPTGNTKKVIPKSDTSIFYNDDFKKSALYRFFMEDFENSTFARQLNIDRSDSIESKMETLLTKIGSEEGKSGGEYFPVIFLVLMIVNVILVSVIVYMMAFRLKMSKPRHEVHLSPILGDCS